MYGTMYKGLVIFSRPKHILKNCVTVYKSTKYKKFMYK